MEPVVLHLDLDAAAGAGALDTGVSLVQADRCAYLLHARIRDGEREIDYPSATSAKIVFIRSDGTRVRGECEIGEEGIFYEIGTSELEVPGPVVGAVQLWNGEEQRLTSSLFAFQVRADPLDKEAISSTSRLPELEAMFAEMNEALAIVKGWVAGGAEGLPVSSGAGISILGMYPSIAELRAQHPRGEAGDAWAIGTAQGNTICVWDVDEEAWKDIGAITGPRGAAGADGAPGAKGEKGEKGEKGDRGEPGVFKILGTYASLLALQAAVPNPADGDMYNVGQEAPYHIYRYDGGRGAWEDQGRLQGERGEKGEKGEKGDKGDKGDTGARGTDGAAGTPGQKGDTGEKGDKGDPALVNGKSGASITLSDQDIAYTGSAITAETLRDAVDAAFQSASDGKAAVAGAIKTPATSSMTFAQLSGLIDTARATMATHLTAKGVTATSGEALQALANKIASAGGASGVQAVLSHYTTSGTVTAPAGAFAYLACGVGGGGGAAFGVSNSSNNGKCGHGGTVKTSSIKTTTPGATFSITIGAGGSGGGSSSAQSALKGGTTSGFGLSCAGGAGGDVSAQTVTPQTAAPLFGMDFGIKIGGAGRRLNGTGNNSAENMEEFRAGGGFTRYSSSSHQYSAPLAGFGGGGPSTVSTTNGYNGAAGGIFVLWFTQE